MSMTLTITLRVDPKDGAELMDTGLLKLQSAFPCELEAMEICEESDDVEMDDDTAEDMEV